MSNLTARRLITTIFNRVRALHSISDVGKIAQAEGGHPPPWTFRVYGGDGGDGGIYDVTVTTYKEPVR